MVNIIRRVTNYDKGESIFDLLFKKTPTRPDGEKNGH